MNLSTGSRITINGKHGTTVIVDGLGNCCMFKYDDKDRIFEVRDEIIIPIKTK